MANGKKSWFFKNIANFVTVIGLITTLWFLIVAVNSPDMLWLVLTLAVITGLSDFIDGKLARYLDIRTAFGITLDRLRDKIFVCSALAILFWQYWPSNGNIILAGLTETLVILIILLEVLILATLIYGLCIKKNVSAGQNGKIKMFGEFFAIAFWFISLSIDKYCAQNSLCYMIYVVDLILLVSFYFGVKGFAIYCRKYFKPQTETENK